jgi:hypothetical protein
MLSSWDPENSALKVVDFGCSLPDGCEVVSRIDTTYIYMYLMMTLMDYVDVCAPS